jgi:hypothetical protein
MRVILRQQETFPPQHNKLIDRFVNKRQRLQAVLKSTERVGTD